MAELTEKMNRYKKFKRTKIRKKDFHLLLMALPMIVFVFIFRYIPMIGTVIAFKKPNFTIGILKSEWVGFDNFKYFFSSPDAWRITSNTLGYNLIFILLSIVVSSAVAILLFEVKNRKLIKIYQTAMFIPHLLSWVVVAYLLYAFIAPSKGLLNQFLKMINITPPDWYLEPTPWRFILPAANIWHGMGISTLMYYAKLMSINPQYFEAAKIEGANMWQITMKITVPFLYPLIIILTILAIGRIFQGDFGLFYQLPKNSSILYRTTDIIDTYVYRALAQVGNIGVPAALGLYRSFMGMVLVILTNAIVNKINQENALF